MTLYPVGARVRVARFSFVKHTKPGKNIPKIPNGQTIHQHFPVQGPTKFTQIGNFGMKISHLATQARTRASFVM
jgi:hypothetical protein